MDERVNAVNDILQAGEPGNISVDEHSGYTGYKPQAILDAMNEVFWGQWGFDELSSEVAVSDKGGLAIAQVKVWLKDIDFHPTGWGQNRVTRGDIGDARKGAQTDAIKKALSYFSIGNRAYHGLLPDGKPASASRSVAKPAPRRSAVAQSSITAPTASQLRKRSQQLLPGKWDEVLTRLFGAALPDDNLTPEQCARIHQQLNIVEQRRAKAS